MITPLLAALFDFNVSPSMVAVVVPVAAVIFGGVMGVCAMYFKHQQRQMWHETARIALEKGQPLPTPLDERAPAEFRVRRQRNDLRAGLILIAVSAGIFVFLREVAGRGADALAAIPGFIGLALLILGLFASKDSKNSVTPGDFPPRSRSRPMQSWSSAPVDSMSARRLGSWLSAINPPCATSSAISPGTMWRLPMTSRRKPSFKLTGGTARFRGEASFSTWLLGIAHNHWRNARRRQRDDVVWDETTEGSPAIEDTARASDLRHDLDLALRRLSPDEQLAIHLSYQQGLSHGEIAALLDWPLGTVKTHLARSKETLRHHLAAWNLPT